jgi:WD40 repeat protein
MRRHLAAAIGALAVSLAVSLSAPLASAQPAQGVTADLFYTTFAGGQNVWRVHAVYTGNGTAGNGTFTLSGDINLASTPGADGIVRNPNNGFLLVGGQGNAVHQVNPATGAFTTATPGVNAFHLAVDPSLQTVWASGIPGSLSSLPINPTLSGPGTILPLSGDDGALTSLAFAPGGTVFYTASGAGGFGNVGTVDLATGVTTRLLSGVAAAHGMAFDPFSGMLVLGGGDQLAMIDPANPTTVASSLAFRGFTLDQGAVDGQGHVFFASNTGHLIFVDYHTTSLIGDANNFVATPFLRGALDDVAPLIGAGGTRPPGIVPEPQTWSLLGLGLATILWRMRTRRVT